MDMGMHGHAWTVSEDEDVDLRMEDLKNDQQNSSRTETRELEWDNAELQMLCKIRDAGN